MGDNSGPMGLVIVSRRPLCGAGIPLLLGAMVIFLALLLGAAPARAEDKTAARDHWERGTKFYDLGKYDDAIREFEAAYQAKGDPAFLYNLAQSHRLAGHPSDSLRFYRTYLRYVPKAANRGDIEDRIKELEKTVAEHPAGESVTAPPTGVTPTAPPGVTAAHPAQNSAALDPGAGGVSPRPQPVGAESPVPGAAAEVAPPGAVGMALPTPPPPVPKKSGRKKVGIVLVAGGGAMVLVGAIFGLVARSQSTKVETAANNGERFDPSVESLGKSSQALQWVGYGIGIAAAVTGLILYATAPSATETAAPQVAIAPVAVPGLTGGALRVTF
jgi:tetratricopeptide (TPR) repeat protein